MEFGNATELRDESVPKEIHVDEYVHSVVAPKKEEDIANSDVPIRASETSEQVPETEGLNASRVAKEPAATVSECKLSNSLKGSPTPKGVDSKNGKLAKDKPNLKGIASASRYQRSMLSQNLSFPATRVHAVNTRKSTDGLPEKIIAKHAQDDGAKAQVPSSNGSIASVSHLSQPNRLAATGLHSKEPNTNADKAFTRCTPSAIIPSCQRAVSVESGSSVAATLGSSSEVSEPAGQNSKSTTTTLPSREEDNTHSIASSATPCGQRSSGSGFSFRLNERAEKRKQVVDRHFDPLSAY
uniref:Uncharacterized protein n=1 Tax=Rhizophora mucronata TaxID=61149 RepID=A0A2P2LLH4_RHIMU